MKPDDGQLTWFNSFIALLKEIAEAEDTGDNPEE